ncbi:uncharacterized protein E5676_scaffold1441G00320 [Cucumis melo var. makuwa]|uniref:Aminotransferase-like plant mobile domain-containing protein n=1 Tax=Cucumis melo var. makuwa TaxID=1194695 RepID=A0A5D3DQM0_CUCMM|nr:uncharacterized protein E5676_scaffold1441G00320 [Cucumis melo var. makuwa]
METCKGCGYYVQKYIHEIVHNSSTSITNLFITKNAYRQEEIDEIRTEWAAFVSRFVSTALVEAIRHLRRASLLAIQLLLGDDRAFVVGSTALVGAMRHPRYIIIILIFASFMQKFYFSPWCISLSILIRPKELAVARNTSVLKCARLFNAMMASMYTYDRNSDIVRAFCEAWCPSTNTLHISSGEMSISLWDLWVIGGLLIKAYYHIASQRMDHSQIPVFKVAGLMAEGYTFSLAIPILANIYSGLCQIHDSTSSLGHSNACFPIHYVHGWLALYFNTHYKVPTSLGGPSMVEFFIEGETKYYTNLESHIFTRKNRPTPPLIKSKTTRKTKHNFDSGNKKICSSKTEERPVGKTKEDTKYPVATSTPHAQFKFPTRSGTDNVGKDLHIVTTGKRPSTHTEDTQCSNDDRHWKRPKRFINDNMLCSDINL